MYHIRLSPALLLCPQLRNPNGLLRRPCITGWVRYMFNGKILAETMKILVVHRQKKVIDQVKSVLQDNSPVVIHTASGLDGLLTSRIESFDLIICGTDLPVITGFELVRSIRTNSVNKNTPVILLKDRMDDKMERLAKALNVEVLLPTNEVGHRLADIVQEYIDVLPTKSLSELVTRSRTH